jgi:hypothetical protein
MVKTRSAGSMLYPVIKENSRRHFLNSLLSDGENWLFGTSGGSAGLVCLVGLSPFICVAAGERQWQLRREVQRVVGRRTPRLAPSGTTNLISGSTSTLGSAHVFVDSVYPCAPSR